MMKRLYMAVVITKGSHGEAQGLTCARPRHIKRPHAHVYSHRIKYPTAIGSSCAIAVM